MSETLNIEQIGIVILLVVTGVLFARFFTWFIGFLAALSLGVIAFWIFGATITSDDSGKLCEIDIKNTTDPEDYYNKSTSNTNSDTKKAPKCFETWENGRLVKYVVFAENKREKWGTNNGKWVKLSEERWDKHARKWVPYITHKY